MEIIDIYPPYIYSIHYDDEEECEYDRLFQLWNDVGYVVNFMTENKTYLQSSIWKKIIEPEDAARQVLAEATDLEDYFETLEKNVNQGTLPDFDSYFKILNGRKYEFELERLPMKSYGLERPSLLRLYAIKLQSNLYIITGGGIKLADSIQNSPGLKDHVLQNIDRVREFLKSNCIMDANDLN